MKGMAFDFWRPSRFKIVFSAIFILITVIVFLLDVYFATTPNDFGLLYFIGIIFLILYWPPAFTASYFPQTISSGISVVFFLVYVYVIACALAKITGERVI